MCVSVYRALKNTLYLAPVQVKLQSGKKKDTLLGLEHINAAALLSAG